MKLLTLLLPITALTTSINATALDDIMKKQCQYHTYGNGTQDYVADGILMGIIVGITYAVPSKDIDTSKTINNGMISDMACKNALNNIGKYGFADDYKWEVLKLVSKKYSDLPK